MKHLYTYAKLRDITFQMTVSLVSTDFSEDLSNVKT
jgi:hypothetical protein